MFMGTDSMSRRRYQEVRNRSNMRREDSRGRAYFRSYEKPQSHQERSISQSQSRQNIPRELSLSQSRYRNIIRSQSENYYVRDSHHKYEDKPKCGVCWCDNCKKRRDKIDGVAVNLLRVYRVLSFFTVFHKQLYFHGPLFPQLLFLYAVFAIDFLYSLY